MDPQTVNRHATEMQNHSSSWSESRLSRIEQARQLAMVEAVPQINDLVAPWIVQSWQRCLTQGRKPDESVNFEAVSTGTQRQAAEASLSLRQAARPILRQLGNALAETRYFAILTNQDGVVVDVDGLIDLSDRRAALISRIGVDLSERTVGTTAIGAALRELQPVWLHRGEHFFQDTSVYSCAGVPLFDPEGRCAGMLDLTGVETVERPELLHLAKHAALRIENALVLQRPHSLLLRLNWPGLYLGDDSDGLVALDADGQVMAANGIARQLLPMLSGHQGVLHSSELFAMPWSMLFDTTRLGQVIEVPLWSGLRLQVRSERVDRVTGPGNSSRPESATASPQSLRDVETSLIRKAVEDTRGNVAQAALNLGISRATVYRKLGRRNKS